MLFNFIDIDLNEKGKIYKTLYLQIKEAVLSGVIKKGERLPSVREAAVGLGVSRTTVENAYLKLCIEGIAESIPQKGYYICKAANEVKVNNSTAEEQRKEYKYDFSSQNIDMSSADTENFKKIVRKVLNFPENLTSYGDPQGELQLREAIAEYTYKARGVKASPRNIVIGAGIGPLLNIICGLLGRDIKVGFENGTFLLAQNIFSDYGIENFVLPSDKNGALIGDIEKSEANVLFLMPSSLSKINVREISKRRNEYAEWLAEQNNRIIIEDDYNGELRYTARSLTAFSANSADKTIYIGSFSKLLLPSVRIAFMVLPDFLAGKFRERKKYYNQTCGKIEQMALSEYINNGLLEKHLRKLRRLYYFKSQLLCKEINQKIPFVKEILLYESSLTIEIITNLKVESREIVALAEEYKIKLLKSERPSAVRLCFAGIDTKDIPEAVDALKQVFDKLNQ